MATAIRRATRARRARAQAAAHIYTTNELFNEWANQAHADLVMLTTETPHGPYPYAGTPWFTCPFGRDALIVGLMTLWADPALSRGDRRGAVCRLLRLGRRDAAVRRACR
jgi:glycogen debranching enzyme